MNCRTVHNERFFVFLRLMMMKDGHGMAWHDMTAALDVRCLEFSPDE
jgi:hypothetical protein